MKARAASAEVLLIATDFFGYAREIASLLESRGRKVLRFEDRPATDTFTKAALRIAPSLLAAKADAYFAEIAAHVRTQPIRDVLVIKGEALSVPAIRLLREALPTARFTLYFWDGYGNMPADSSQKVGLFDRALTFDPVDARKDARLAYRPLFFPDRYAQLTAIRQDIDLLFVGTAHGDRYPILRRLARALPPQLRFEQILYFPSRLIYRVRRIFDPRLRGARRSEFIFKPLGREEMLRLLARARVVVDIERPVQTGLTMRTFEALGAGRKLVTTNSSILEADFYNPANVTVIDRHKPAVDTAFLAAPYVSPPASVLRRYTLSGWLDEVLPSGPRA
jgi:hypothetical protein